MNAQSAIFEASDPQSPFTHTQKVMVLRPKIVPSTWELNTSTFGYLYPKFEASDPQKRLKVLFRQPEASNTGYLEPRGNSGSRLPSKGFLYGGYRDR